MRELTEMQRLSGASALALELQTKKNQQLQHEIVELKERLTEINEGFRAVMAEECAPDEKHCTCVPTLRAKMALMQKSIDTLIDQRDTAEAQIKRLLDLLERTQAQRDAAQAELNRVLAARGAK